MEKMQNALRNDCEMKGVSPLRQPFPYPPMQVREKNQYYADLLTVDYCGSVSEMTAIMQYLHGQNYLSCSQCPKAAVILGIAMAEMIHLQKLGQMILLLGGRLDYSVRTCSGPMFWTPQYVNFAEREDEILSVNIDGERAAINQYRKHMSMIGDDCVTALLARIIQDEEYHIMLLQEMSSKEY
ncbi:MAG: ferritin-like domain-containing protein [Lachnospiraceae bacterium]|nr:ferritin-like domain-containing protein [Lachnospiraceae bacterium]MDY4070118.1 ferritin-like domain-containing protein [Lachnospiraceae bacterium]